MALEVNIQLSTALFGPQLLAHMRRWLRSSHTSKSTSSVAGCQFTGSRRYSKDRTVLQHAELADVYYQAGSRYWTELSAMSKTLDMYLQAFSFILGDGQVV